MNPIWLVVLGMAALDWIAVGRGWRKIEYFAKPMTLALLLAIFVLEGKLANGPLISFGLGFLLSLLGDIFLMLTDRWFLAGLAAFLLAHLAYIVGFNLPIPQVDPCWSSVIALTLAFSAGRILQRILIGLRVQGLERLTAPVVLYGAVITFMLLSALLTFFRPEWSVSASLLAFVGALLFYISDIILAWNKFVAPVRHGRLWNIMTYHLGQTALALAAVLQFAR
ncbi:MAG: lysoplasmalogenase [Anaerolineales bacterium]|nr:lysoplasmalogenase [Anaerolineales bacterium]MCX7609115.1 lysoplasmalogenase [Anaerolineales bacterium]MDW8227089.1 lysoplasmalogenase family protein [Anaerolineales bacterium]